MTKELSRINRGFLNPFRELSIMNNSFDRLFNELDSFRRGTGVETWFSPSCDIVDDKNQYILKFDMPGVEKKDIKVELNEHQLTVSAERRSETETDEKNKYLSEIRYGSYSRSFTLPEQVDEKKIEAKLADGVLTLRVPKTETAKTTKSQQISIQ